MTVRDLLDNVSATELAEWRAFDSMSPIGGERLDINAGYIVNTIGSIMSESTNSILDTTLNFEYPFLSDENKKMYDKVKEQSKPKPKGYVDLTQDPEILITKMKGLGKKK